MCGRTTLMCCILVGPYFAKETIVVHGSLVEACWRGPRHWQWSCCPRLCCGGASACSAHCLFTALPKGQLGGHHCSGHHSQLAVELP